MGIIEKILKEEYSFETPFSINDISYTIDNYSNNKSSLSVKCKDERFNSLHAFFDNEYFIVFGNFGMWGFSCDHITNITNIPYEKPHLLLEKLQNRKPYEFDVNTMRTTLIKKVKESYFYELLSDEDKKNLETFITADDVDFCDFDLPDEIEEDSLVIKEVYKQTDELSFIKFVSTVDFSTFLFNCDLSELYNIGNKIPIEYFLILNILQVVSEDILNPDNF